MSNNQTNQAGHGEDNAERDRRDAEAMAAFNRCEAAGMTSAYSPDTTTAYCPDNNTDIPEYTYQPTSPAYQPTSPAYTVTNNLD